MKNKCYGSYLKKENGFEIRKVYERGWEKSQKELKIRSHPKKLLLSQALEYNFFINYHFPAHL